MAIKYLYRTSKFFHIESTADNRSNSVIDMLGFFDSLNLRLLFPFYISKEGKQRRFERLAHIFHLANEYMYRNMLYKRETCNWMYSAERNTYAVACSPNTLPAPMCDDRRTPFKFCPYCGKKVKFILYKDIISATPIV